MGNLGTRRRRAYVGLVAALTALSLTMFGALVSPASAGGQSHRLHAGVKKIDRHTKITSFVSGRTASGRQVTGKFVPKRFMMSGDQLVAQGVLKGKVKRPGPDRKFTKRGVIIPVHAVNGKTAPAPSSARANAAFPPTPAPGACNVLNLVLGPLDLNLLGLQIHLDTVTLNIVAQSGAGQLLGNLLCAVANLLNNGGPLSGLLGQLNTLLTQILGALGGLRA